MLITDSGPDLKPFLDVIDGFAAQYLTPVIKDTDRYPFSDQARRLVEDRFERLYRLGLLGITVPTQFGGIGEGTTVLCAILGRLAEIDASFSGFIFTNALSQELLLQAAEGEGLADLSGKATTARECALAFSSFTNPAQLAVLPAAARRDDGFALSGVIEYLVLGGYSRYAIIPARIDDHSEYSLFLVDLDQAGIDRSDPIVSLGLHALPAVDVTLTSAQATLLGTADSGATYFRNAACTLHVAAAAISAGIMRASFKEAHEYAQLRRQGGRTIINWSEVRMMLAGMLMRTTTADLCLAQYCRENGTGSAAVLLIHEMAAEVVTDGVQLLGGNGYTKDYGQEKRYRDARQVQSFLGTHAPKKLALIMRDESHR